MLKKQTMSLKRKEKNTDTDIDTDTDTDIDIDIDPVFDTVTDIALCFESNSDPHGVFPNIFCCWLLRFLPGGYIDHSHANWDWGKRGVSITKKALQNLVLTFNLT